MFIKKIISVALFFISNSICGQYSLEGIVMNKQEPIAFVNIYCKELDKGTSTNEKGYFKIDFTSSGEYHITISYVGFQTLQQKIIVSENHANQFKEFQLEPEASVLDEIVVSGTLKAVSRLETPVPVEIYSVTFLKKNPTPNIFEAMQNVNGVRPQVNCSICNTGDIHINGLEGPYTMVTIDGMPIVSGLSTVYGLSGIPNSLIERIEIVKGPASSLYGSEAVGGLINIITKDASIAPKVSFDIFSTSWLEHSIDLGFKKNFEKSSSLLGISFFNYQNPIDHNHDNFTDVTLQNRISIFNKWHFDRNNNKNFQLAARYFYEDRWGGEMQWNKNYRVGNEVYGESIYTNRAELLGQYELPMTEKMLLSFSLTGHDQNSAYGTTIYNAQQYIGFGQLTWDKEIKKHELLLGTTFRYQFYNDNSMATKNADKTTITSLFIQDEWKFYNKQSLLAGSRLDYNSNHGIIYTPRLAYKWKPKTNSIFRINAGTGFRIVNLFTEEHAALTGAREVVILEDIKPEQSYNVNLNYLYKGKFAQNNHFTIETSLWYTYFTNQIAPDYDTNPNQIIYSNLNGYSESIGGSINLDIITSYEIKANIGTTLIKPTLHRDGISTAPILTEKWSGTWGISYITKKGIWSFDYTGNIYGPMRLPLASALDPRKEYSPVWSIQNIQTTYKGFQHFEIYGGIKNLLNWTPAKNNPFLIARANDPFDQNVQYDTNGNVIPSTNNPYALSFDPTYIYAPNQGIRAFIGIRHSLN
ncbi:TonB-dependent receptor [Flavobacterium haoranii]|uniref:Outer membrane receptor for ferrienterochelin and colicins n=1 Tax=Flavobacterium haoranii TaxID=683124 RepID=A0A1M6F1X0_9FLAO|nr:TonB-dependent receptor [Flavobacterium haoranii]SHI91697.1 outer membrane receptor for ferrienterochelin and colicins [Flavobacterium haoranii]